MSFLQALKEKVSSKLSTQEHESTVQPDTDELSADTDNLDNQQQNDQSAGEQPVASVFARAKDAWNQGTNKIKAVISSNDPVETIEEAEEIVEEAVVTTAEAALDHGTEKTGSLFETMKETLSQEADKLKDKVASMGSSIINTDKSDDETGDSDHKNDENQVVAVDKDVVVLNEAAAEKSTDSIATTKVMAVTDSAFSLMKSALSKGMETIKDTASNIDLPDSIADAAKGILSRKNNDDLQNNESETVVKAKVQEVESVSEATENILEKTNAEVNISNDEAEESNNLTRVAAATAVGSVFGLLKSTLSKGVDAIKDTASDIDMSGSVTDMAKNAFSKGTDAFKEVAGNFNTSETTDATETVLDNIEQKVNGDTSAVNEQTDAGQKTAKAGGSTEAEFIPNSIAETVDTNADISDSFEQTVDEIFADSLEPETMGETVIADTKTAIDDVEQETVKAVESTEIEPALDSVAEVVDTDVTKADRVEDIADGKADVEAVVADSLKPETVIETVIADTKTAIDDVEQETVKAVESTEIEPALDSVAEVVDTDVTKADRVEDIVDGNADVEAIVADSLKPETVVETFIADTKTAIDDAEQETVNAVESAEIEPALDSVAEVVNTDASKTDEIEDMVAERANVEARVTDSLEPETMVETLTADAKSAIDYAEWEASEVVTSAAIKPDGTKLPQDDSTIVTAVNTFGTAFESESKASATEAKERPETVNLNSADSWTVEDSTVVSSNPFDADKVEETTIPTFDAYDESNLGVYAEPEKKTRYGWVLPVVLLSLFSAAWWLNFAPGKQSSGDVDFAMLEEAPVARSAVSSVAMDAAELASVNEDTRLSEVASAEVLAVDEANEQAGRVINAPSSDEEIGVVAMSEEILEELQPEASPVTLGAAYEGPLSKLASIDDGIALPEAVSAEVLVVDEQQFDVQGETVQLQTINAQSDVSGADVVAMIQAPEPVVEQKNDGPVKAVARFLATDNRDSLPKGFVLYGLNFDTASSRISKDSAKIISDLAATLEVYPTTRIRLEGHTDNRGKAVKNLALSNSRARAVKAALVSLNLDPTHISAVGMGDEYPIMDNETKMGQAENRRVEIIITER